MEERIRNLCSQLLNTNDPVEAEVIGKQLRSAIHEQIESVRHEITQLPTLDAILIH